MSEFPLPPILTIYLKKLHRTYPKRAEWALKWRPKFLATVRETGSVMMACLAARIDYTTVKKHLESDHEFEKQLESAKGFSAAMLG